MIKKITLREIEIFLCHVLQVDRSYLKTHPERVLSAEQLLNFFELFYRRINFEPIAYLTGRKEFWDLNLLITKDVLIPRPETEMLVEKALQLIPESSYAKILELGTGSGAISLSIAKHRKNVSIIATDLSFSALKVAKSNAEYLNINNVNFLCCDWFAGISDKSSIKFDIIISNPPYIGFNEIILCDQEIFHEPNLALFSEEEGLGSLKKIIFSSSNYLKPKGHLLLEHGVHQKTKLIGFFQETSVFTITTFKDLSGIDRIIVATKNQLN